MTFSIALAKSEPVLAATWPTKSSSLIIKNSPTALVSDATTGVPLARDSSADRQKVSIGPGAIDTSADAITDARYFLSEIYPRKVTGISREDS